MDSTTIVAVQQVLDEFAVRFGATGARLWADLIAYHVAGAWVVSVIAGVAATIFTFTLVGSVAHLVRTLAAPEAATLLKLLGR